MEWLALPSLIEIPPLLGAINLRLNFFDALFIGLVGYGFHQGKRDGASGTWMSFLQWLVIALPGGLMGGLFGSLFRSLLGASPYWSQLFGYVGWLLLVCGGFSYLSSQGKDEAIDGDKFGRMEYPLGILGGMLKHFFILLMVMSFLNARVYTPQQLTADRQAQIEEFGTALFPTRASLYAMAFSTSFFGPRINTVFGWALLQPVMPAIARR
jgi:hypothetical protein